MQLQARAELERRQRLGLLKPLWQPLPGPQTEAFNCEADILFYGGQAGGGKTDLLIGLAVTAHRKSIIFRREFSQFREVIERGREIIGIKGQLNENSHIWRGLPGGRMLELGAVQHEHTKNKYKGRPHDLKAFDEVTEFTQTQFQFLTGWMRTTVPGQRCRVVATGNPPTTPEGEWVMEFWGPWLDDQHPYPAKPGELRWYAMVDGKEEACETGNPFEHKGEVITPQSRTFIPARLEDNPYLLATGYGTTLQNLPEPLRSILRGQFGAAREDDPWQVIPTAHIDLAQKRWREREAEAKAKAEAKTEAEAEIEKGPLMGVGVDVARGGKDKTVISGRYGNWFAPLLKYSGKETADGPTAAGKVMKALEAAEKNREQAVIEKYQGRELTPEEEALKQVELLPTNPMINVDVIGVGSSVYDHLRLVLKIPNVEGINFAAGSSATDRTGKFQFKNLRAEAYWKLREALDPVTGDNLALPPDPELKADLCAPRYRVGMGGIQIEEKEDIKERIGRSPDCGDAVVLASYISAGAALVDYYRRKAEAMKKKE